MVSFTIKGKIPAKSSGRQMFKNKKTRKFFPANNKAYTEYEKSFIDQVNVLGLNTIQLPVNPKNRIAVLFIVYDTAKRQDADSFAKTLLDCLQKSAVIANDNKVDNPDTVRLVDKENPRVVIYLKEITLPDVNNIAVQKIEQFKRL